MNTRLEERSTAPAAGIGRIGDLPLTLTWVGEQDGVLRLLDQTLLPQRVEMRDCATVEDVWEAIRVLRVRGAPAIGVAAAYGMCLGLRAHRDASAEEFQKRIVEVGDYLCGCRPTAVNLAWAVDRIRSIAVEHSALSSGALWDRLLDESHRMAREDAETCRKIGEAGAELIPEGGGVLTHCNAGALATVAYGTALSLMYVAHERGRRFRVYADETRPLLQGARLTAFELAASGLDVTVLCDGAAASLMQSGKVNMVVVGADRIAANGDVANKIGTYGVALCAARHGIPFYVAAPLSTFDRTLSRGADIPIEMRGDEEVCCVADRRMTPADVSVYNPAFDVTPAELITGIVTEKGVAQPVTKERIAGFFEGAA